MTVSKSTPVLPSAHKILPRHLDRLAIVYIRQSTPHQVASDRASTDLQYQLRCRAAALGGPEDRAPVIDGDRGLSGQSVANRPGFQRLLAEGPLGHVGIAFGREVSRLARSCKDRHQLPEVCGLFRVPIGDAGGVSDPTEANGRRPLGLRGMMSEAELRVLRPRPQQGKVNKARRGERCTCVPVGYVRTPEGIALEPDERVRSAITVVSHQSAELGALTKPHAFPGANGVQLGVRIYRGPNKGQLVWPRPRRGALYEMLRHPFYAGAYACGGCPFDPSRRSVGKKGSRRNAPRDGWVCLLHGEVPAYTTWQQYEENQRRLASNDRGRRSKTAPGRAPTLLNGIVRCGRRGRAMPAHSARPTANPRYACAHEFAEYGGPRCQSVTAAYPDRLVEGLVLRAVEPAASELSCRAAERVEQERARLHLHWKQRLERADYEVSRARRQYDAVDPEDRLVARELERQWEQKRAERQRLEEDYARFRPGQPRHPTAADRERIRGPAADLPSLWQAETTAGADRRAVVRLLSERVELTRHGESEQATVVVHRRGGATTRHEITRGLRRYTDLHRCDRLRQRVIAPRGEGKTAEQIAAIRTGEGYAVPRGRQYNGHRVRQLFARFGLTGTPAGIAGAEGAPGTDEWWLPARAAELGVKPIVVHRWRWSGCAQARQLRGGNGRWIVRADSTEIKRLRRRRAFETAHPGRRPPRELTTAPKKTAAKRRTTHERKGGK